MEGLAITSLLAAFGFWLSSFGASGQAADLQEKLKAVQTEFASLQEENAALRAASAAKDRKLASKDQEIAYLWGEVDKYRQAKERAEAEKSFLAVRAERAEQKAGEFKKTQEENASLRRALREARKDAYDLYESLRAEAEMHNKTSAELAAKDASIQEKDALIAEQAGIVEAQVDRIVGLQILADLGQERAKKVLALEAERKLLRGKLDGKGKELGQMKEKLDLSEAKLQNADALHKIDQQYLERYQGEIQKKDFYLKLLTAIMVVLGLFTLVGGPFFVKGLRQRMAHKH